MNADILGGLAESLGGERTVVACSGGRDSVVLLHALVRAGADVRVAHVDHGLREDSADDARFCARLAAELGVRFATTRLQITPGNSTQGRARTQRYAALVRLATELGGTALAVAHHADDAWESVQLMTERQAGAAGARGPAARTDWWGFPIVRPLLGVRRAAIDAYARHHGLAWRDDPTNLDPRYARARLRQAGGFDAGALRAARAAGDELARALEQAPRPTWRAPVAMTFARGDLAQMPAAARAATLIRATRALHGELPRDAVAAAVDAIGDDRGAPRRFCARRAVVTITGGAVRLDATRGQGTRLLDARRTAAVPLRGEQTLPWFAHRLRITTVRTASAQVGLRPATDLVLRGPIAGDRLAGCGSSVLQILAEAGVDPTDRWCWPCVYRGDECLVVCGCAVAPARAFFLPDGDISGIFVESEPLLCLARRA